MATIFDRLPPPEMQPVSAVGINWRAPVIRAAFRLQNPEILRELDLIHSVERSPVKLRATHEERLEKLLQFAWSETEYYHEVLERCGAIRNGRANNRSAPIDTHGGNGRHCRRRQTVEICCHADPATSDSFAYYQCVRRGAL